MFNKPARVLVPTVKHIANQNYNCHDKLSKSGQDKIVTTWAQNVF